MSLPALSPRRWSSHIFAVDPANGTNLSLHSCCSPLHVGDRVLRSAQRRAFRLLCRASLGRCTARSSRKSVVKLIQRLSRFQRVDFKQLLEQLRAHFPRVRAQSMESHGEIHEFLGRHCGGRLSVSYLIAPVRYEALCYPCYEFRLVWQQRGETLCDEIGVPSERVPRFLRDCL